MTMDKSDEEFRNQGYNMTCDVDDDSDCNTSSTSLTSSFSTTSSTDSANLTPMAPVRPSGTTTTTSSAHDRLDIQNVEDATAVVKQRPSSCSVNEKRSYHSNTNKKNENKIFPRLILPTLNYASSDDDDEMMPMTRKHVEEKTKGKHGVRSKSPSQAFSSITYFPSTTTQLVQMARAILFALWIFLSLFVILQIHFVDDNNDGSVIPSHTNGLRSLVSRPQGSDGGSIITHLPEKSNDQNQKNNPLIPLPPNTPPQQPQPPKRIPLPLPPTKISVIIMNHSRPRMIQQSTLLPTLLSHPSIDEVLLLHSNPDTAFQFVHPKVINIDASLQNEVMGLSLRFYYAQMARNEWVIQVDDDMEFELGVLSEMVIEFGKNTRRIVGRFGRDLSSLMDKEGDDGCGNSYQGYCSKDTHAETEVILTKLMIMERRLCSSFFEYEHLIWDDIILDNGEGPLWNGEDIFMSLVANHVYGNGRTDNNYAMDWLDVKNAPDSLKDYKNGALDISGGMSGLRIWDWHWWQSLLRRNRHYSYRGMLWQMARERLRESGGPVLDGREDER